MTTTTHCHSLVKWFYCFSFRLLLFFSFPFNSFTCSLFCLNNKLTNEFSETFPFDWFNWCIVLYCSSLTLAISSRNSLVDRVLSIERNFLKAPLQLYVIQSIVFQHNNYVILFLIAIITLTLVISWQNDPSHPLRPIVLWQDPLALLFYVFIWPVKPYHRT